MPDYDFADFLADCDDFSEEVDAMLAQFDADVADILASAPAMISEGVKA